MEIFSTNTNKTALVIVRAASCAAITTEIASRYIVYTHNEGK